MHFLYFVDATSQLMIGGVDGCFLLGFEYESRYKAKQALVLDPEGKYVEVEIEKYVLK